MSKKSLKIPGRGDGYGWFLLLLFWGVSFLLFSSILHKSFATDDFQVLKRVGMDGVIWIKDFFRPLSDITLYFNYLVGGFEPAGYYLLNMLIHGTNCYLLYLFCLRWNRMPSNAMAGKYALISSLLFLTYPFHNECIVWGLGRASILAAIFGMAALVITVSNIKRGWKVFWVCLFYFIGMTGYESIVLLPLMIFVILYEKGIPRRQYALWAIAMGGTLGAYLVIRITVSGGLVGPYTGDFFRSGLLKYAANAFKVTGRLFLPPFEDSRKMLLLFGVVVIFLLLLIALFLKKSWQQVSKRNYFFLLLLLLIIACIPTVISGVSTRTSEADRLLYFPSFFLCSGMAFLLVNLVNSNKWLFLAVFCLLIYQVVQLKINHRNWMRASGITKEFLQVLSHRDPAKKMYLINLPDELDGAFIFRLGLKDALLMYGVDTSNLFIVNHLERKEMLVVPDSIPIVKTGAGIGIAPDVTIRQIGNDSLQILTRDRSESFLSLPDEEKGPFSLGASRKDIILYWNKKGLTVVKID